MLPGAEIGFRSLHSNSNGLKIEHVPIRWDRVCCDDVSQSTGTPGRETRQSLAYNFHEDLLPVLTGLETVPESRALWEELELLLQECLPFQVVSICLEGRFPLVGCL